MKKYFSILATFLSAAVAIAQTPEEIISKMEAASEKYDSQGTSMIIDIKMPVLGTMSTKVYSLGNKSRVEAKMMGIEMITWSDEVTDWTYNSKKNEITISYAKAEKDTGSEADMEMFDDLDDGYDLSIVNETDKAWYILCKKTKDNKDKDAPKTVNISVEKGTYLPLSLNTRMKGVSFALRNIKYGVTEKQVTFNPQDYPNATIVDERNQSN